MKEHQFGKMKVGWNAILIIVGLILGFFFAAQWNVAPESNSSLPAHTRDDLAATILQLEEEQKSLKEAINQLRQELARQQKEVAESTEHLKELTADLDAQRMIAGLYPLKGPGLSILLSDSKVDNLPAGADPNLYIIHEYDLRDVVNSLWAAGAEAIAINEERIVGNTSIYCVGSTIMVNDTRLSPPYTIVAIGDATQFERALENPATLKELRARAKVYGLEFKVTKEKEVIVPAYKGSFSLRYARPAS